METKQSRVSARNLLSAATVLSLYVSAFFITKYLQIEPEPLVRILAFLLLLIVAKFRKKYGRLENSEIACMALFSFLLGASLVLGYHIVIENGNGYHNLMDESYISAYSFMDFIALIWISSGLYLLSTSLFQLLKNTRTKPSRTFPETYAPLRKVRFGTTAVFAAILFLVWIPYLLLYWPGFIFGDSLSSLHQALGLSEWNNHFPIMYSLLIKACLDASSMLGLGPTEGCAIYSIVQMVFMAFCFGYLSNWIVTR